MSRLPVDAESPFGVFAPTLFLSLLIKFAHRVHLHGALRGRFVNLFRRRHPGPVDVTLAGIRWRLYLRHNACEPRLLIRQNRCDRREINAIVAALDHPGAVFADVGANIGLYSLMVAARRPSAGIIAFEPNPDLFRRLEFNAAINGFSHVHSRCLAVGDRAEEGVLSCDADEAGSWGLAEGESGGIAVHVRTLAGVLAADGGVRVAAMKIDVEGHEDRVLLPFLEETPRRDWPRLLVVEHAHRGVWRRDCLDWCLGEGYRVAFTTGLNTVLRRVG